VAEEGEGSGVPPQARVGEQLRAAREAQGLSLEDIAARTRIPMRHLYMIERGDYEGLPAPTYSAGFVKTWARQLGLDGQALADQFRAEAAGAAAPVYQPQSYEPADPRRTPPLGLAIATALLAIVLALGYLYWRGSQEDPMALAARSSDHPAAAAPAHPSPTAAVSAPAAKPIAPPAQNGPVVIGASQDVWIKVADSGKTLFMGVLKAGDHYQVPDGLATPLLTTGRPGNTTIMVGATPIPPVGDPDRAAKNVSLTPQSLLARVATPPPAAQPPAGAPTPVENAAGT
jgi:cytoskeleton protein RodZ